MFKFQSENPSFGPDHTGHPGQGKIGLLVLFSVPGPGPGEIGILGPGVGKLKFSVPVLVPVN